MKAVIYVRVSSGMQADLGTSIPSQIKICKDYAEKNNFKIVKIYTDEGESARSDKRPAFQRMIEDAKKKPLMFEAILIYNQSRFSRNVLDVLTYKNLLRNNGVSVVSVTEPFDEESPQGKLINGIISVINEFYSSNLAKETMRGQRENAKQGFWNGGTPPIGYKVKKIKRGNAEKSTFEIDERYENVVKDIFDMFLKGNGIKKIAVTLNDMGLRTPRGNLWRPSTVRSILINKAYTGTLVWNKYDKKNRNKKYKARDKWVVVEDAYPKIIEPEVFEQIQNIMEKNKMYNPKSIGRPHVMSGLLKCGICGSNYTFCKASKRRGNKFYESGYYRCSTRNNIGVGACDNISLRAEEVEEAVLHSLKEKIFTNENLAKIANELNKNRNVLLRKQNKEKKAITASIQDVDKRIARLLRSIEEGISEDLIAERLNELKSRKDDLTLNLGQIKERIPYKFEAKDIKETVKIIQEGLENADSGKLNAFLKIFVDKVVVFKDRIEIFYTFPEKNDIPKIKHINHGGGHSGKSRGNASKAGDKALVGNGLLMQDSMLSAFSYNMSPRHHSKPRQIFSLEIK
jgi:site-specific DNA recombinase